MAGDWIKLEHATPDKPEVFVIAEHLGIPPEHALGCLIRVWLWADQQIRSGNAASVTETILDRISRVTGFGAAMARAGWVEVTEQGISFPNFARHNGQTAKARALTAKRVARSKGNARVTLAALPEKRREEKSTKGVNPLKPPGEPAGTDPPLGEGGEVPIPDALAGEPFTAAWADWLAYRRKRRPVVTPHAAREQLAALAMIGPAAAVECIQLSIRNGWQGLFPEKFNGSTTHGKRHNAAPGDAPPGRFR